MRIRKFFLSLLLIFVFSVSNVFSQKAVNPEDSFYQDALNWYLKGYVSSLPVIKPYPVNVITSILGIHGAANNGSTSFPNSILLTAN